ncbi:MMPL family transporter [Caballeronia telluris]|uniref:Lipoprotein transmembrane n=1 Tax=Caballeronia telluris TaxID=326475 RepID=A0A158F0I8_9BURK|nr:MMPL family transporter [Caballeronia telluris]SAL13348.1 lipoprotein transmembrane [Caballeronia telluris]
MEILQRPSSRQIWTMRFAWLLFALVAVSYCGWRFAGPSPLQTNLLALLPATEVDPVAEKAADKMAAALGDRTVFIVTSPDAEHAKAAAKQLGATLRTSGAFRSVIATLPPFDVSSIGALYLPYRFGLLAPADRAALQDGSFVAREALLQRLYNPLDSGLSTPLADDPFGWLQRYLGGLPLATSNLELEDGLLVAHRGNTTSVLVTATLNGSAYESGVQRTVRDALARAKASLGEAHPDVTLDRLGAVFYAEAARSASEREVHLIGLVSLCGIGLLMLWVFRSPRLIMLGFLSTALGIVAALAVTMLVFGQLHLLTLVFGASLIGEAVDYSIQYFVVYLGAGRDWDAVQGARKVRPALAVALATSLLGYAVLACVPFPALEQIACFAMAGILTAFASVVWLLPTMLPRPPKHRPRSLFDAAGKLLAIWRRAFGARTGWIFALLLAIVAVPGWLRLSSDDDIRLLIQRDPALMAEERAVRAAVGIDDGAQFFVVRGETPEIVLQRAEALGARLDALQGGERLRGWQSPASFVPSARRQRENRALLAQRLFDDPAKLRATLLEAGFRDNVADAWIAAARSSDAILTVDAWLDAPWSRPFRHLWLGEVDASARTYAAVVMPQGVTPANEAALVKAARAVPGASFVDKAMSVSKLFGAYRIDSGAWLAGATLLVAALLSWRYGLRGGIATTLPVVLAIGVTLAVFGYLRVPFNLFNCLALMLVLGVGANYAVFLREGALRAAGDLGAVWAGVLLSAATTLLSFGMLALSAMPALQSFGATLALGIAVSVMLAPIGMPSKRGDLS